jgi:hypothetical protein
MRNSRIVAALGRCMVGNISLPEQDNSPARAGEHPPRSGRISPYLEPDFVGGWRLKRVRVTLLTEILALPLPMFGISVDAAIHQPRARKGRRSADTGTNGTALTLDAALALSRGE